MFPNSGPHHEGQQPAPLSIQAWGSSPFTVKEDLGSGFNKDSHHHLNPFFPNHPGFFKPEDILTM